MLMTTWEASEKYHLSTRYLRKLLADGVLQGREAMTGPERKVWLLDEDSLIAFLKTERKVGRPKKNET